MGQKGMLSQAGYTKLLADIRKIMKEGKEMAQAAASHELVTAYWNIGKRIMEEKITERAGYKDSIVADLAEELGMDISVLKRCVIFLIPTKVPLGALI